MKLYQLHETWNGINHPVTKQPLFGGSIKVKLAGTSTLASLYSDRTGTAASNPYNLTGFLAQGQVFASGVFDVEVWDGLNGTGSKLDTWEGIKCLSPEYVVLNKSGTYTITVDDDFIIANATSAGFTLNLPPAADSSRPITIYNASSNSNTITIDPNGSETVDGASTKSISVPGASYTLVSTGTQWYTTSSDPIPFLWGNFVPLDSSTTSYTASPGQTVVWSGTGSKTLYLPATPVAGNGVTLIDGSNNFQGYPVTVNRNGSKIQGMTNNITINGEAGIWRFVYVNSTTGWLYQYSYAEYMNNPPYRIFSTGWNITLAVNTIVAFTYQGTFTDKLVWQLLAKNVTTDAAYDPGDILLVEYMGRDTGGTVSRGASIYIDASTLNGNLVVGDTTFVILNKDTRAAASMTLANWVFSLVIIDFICNAIPQEAVRT